MEGGMQSGVGLENESGVASGGWECAEREEWTSEQSVESGEWSLRSGVWRGSINNGE